MRGQLSEMPFGQNVVVVRSELAVAMAVEWGSPGTLLVVVK